MFNYPLRKEELIVFLDTRYERMVFEDALYSLCDAGIIHAVDEFYSLQKIFSLPNAEKKEMNGLRKN